MAGNRVQDNKTLRVWTLDSIASPTLAPTVAELGAAVNITCDIEKGSSIVSFTDDITTTVSGTLCEDSDITTVTGANYGGEHTYKRRFTSGAAATDDVYLTLPAAFTYFYMVVSEGYAFDLAVAAAQKVDVYFLQAGKFRKIRGTGADVIRGKQVYYGAGKSAENVAILA